MPPGATVIDVGANIGMFALYAAVEWRAGRVYAYEPFGESRALLARNAERNRVAAIVPLPEAIAGRAGPRDLHMQGRHGVHSLFGDSADAVRIECITLADAFARHDIARCDFLKLDCEGAEYEILLTAPADVLARIDRIAAEYHDWMTDAPSRRAPPPSRAPRLRRHQPRSSFVAQRVFVRETPVTLSVGIAPSRHGQSQGKTDNGQRIVNNP